MTAGAAGSRLERLRTSGARGSLSSAQDFAAMTSVGSTRSGMRPGESEGGFLDRLVSAWAARTASRSVLSYADSTTRSKKAD